MFLPTLAAKQPPSLDKEAYLNLISKHLPLYVQPKLDGFRCLINEKQFPRSRTDKPIPNKHIKKTLRDLNLPFGFDGELVTINELGKDNFNEVQSKISSEQGAPNFYYTIFDWFGSEEYEKRLHRVAKYLNERGISMPNASLISTQLCDSIDKVKQQYGYWLEQGYEGICLRKLSGRYKQGRSTLNEGILFALTPWETSEARVIGFEEATDQQYGAGKGELGALQCCDADNFTLNFSVGSGFTQEQRKNFWLKQDSLFHKFITYKYKANRTCKDRPISPIFKGFRSGVEL